MTNNCISIERDGDAVRDKKVLVELLNENYTNIVEILSGKKPSWFGNCEDSAYDDANVDKIILKHDTHFGVQKNKMEFSSDKKLILAYANAKDVNKIIKSLNVNKAKGPDGISSKSWKLIKFSASITDCHFENIINKDISNNKYSESAKTANAPSTIQR